TGTKSGKTTVFSRWEGPESRVIREPEDLPDAVKGIGTWNVRYPPKDQVNRVQSLGRFALGIFFCQRVLTIFGYLFNNIRLSSGRANNRVLHNRLIPFGTGCFRQNSLQEV